MTREKAIVLIECSANELRETLKETTMPSSASEQLQMYIDAYEMAISAIRQQEPNDWICTLKCADLMDEGMCSHGGLCCLYESQRTIKENQPLTLDELRKMDGEPVWIVEYPDWGHWELSADAEDYVADREPSFYGMKHNDPAGRYGLHKLGWLAYRQKPEEGTV